MDKITLLALEAYLLMRFQLGTRSDCSVLANNSLKLHSFIDDTCLIGILCVSVIEIKIENQIKYRIRYTAIYANKIPSITFMLIFILFCGLASI